MTDPTEVSSSGSAEENQLENEHSPLDRFATDEWEEGAEDILEQSSYDEELGKQMSRDAIRASRGEMSEEAFYKKYHEDVLAEFGVDERPIPEGMSDD